MFLQLGNRLRYKTCVIDTHRDRNSRRLDERYFESMMMNDFEYLTQTGLQSKGKVLGAHGN